MLPNIDLDSLITVGTFGQVRRGVFMPRGQIATRGIEFKTLTSQTQKTIREESASGLEVRFKAAGQLLPGSSLVEATAGVNVRFSRGGKFLFHADGGREEAMESIADVGRKVRELAQAGKWERDWFVVTKVRRVTSATLLVSASSEGAVDLKAKVERPDLGQADLAFELFHKRDMSSTTMVHGEGPQAAVCATFRLAGLRRRLFTEPGLRTTESAGSPAELRALASFESAAALDEDTAFAELGLDDIDDDFLVDDDDA